ncbi:cadherin-related family member 5 [Indicator indicator]|uniref:cadherin-related family member 5 n=1 Tax=Indicator indicator TaxID=1002788 RepID=UPI0023E01287|nr:cadherin-related family member 5 [Indicator indicator]
MAAACWLLAAALCLLPSTAHVAAQGCSVNDSRPNVPENNPVGYVVTTIHMESGFTARINPASPDASYFALQGSELQLVQSVDYEEVTLLLVSLICENNAGESDSLEIFVTILNENDNSPEFKQTNFTEVVPEDTKVNSTIIAREELSASDADLDTIYYELTTTVPGSDGYFAIKGLNNPEIYLHKALDYEKFKWTTLILYARDRPVTSTDPTNTATATINIIIEQADTKAPWFLPCTFINEEQSICISSLYAGRVNMSEVATEPLLLQPGPLYAIDPDYTINERIIYSIVSGNMDNVFSIDADTGNLTMNKPASSPGSYLLQVMATQVNNIQKYSIASVEIKVINKSNHAPYFESRIYNGTAFADLAPGSFVFQAGHPSSPLMITALDDDFPDKVNPSIEYHISNSTDFIATKDGLILTNVVLQSPGTVTLEAVGMDMVSLQKASTVIVVEVVLAAAVASSDKQYSAQDMGILGGTLAALLLVVLVFLGVVIYKQYGKRINYLVNKKLSKKPSEGYDNKSYKQDEQPDASTEQQEASEDGRVRSVVEVQEQPALPSAFPAAEETESLPKAAVASTIIFDQEEKEEEEVEPEKEVKSILKTDRQVANDGYKAVWFRTDVDPEAGERIQVIEDNAADSDDDSDQDLQRNEEEEDDDKDHLHRGQAVSFASGSSPVPAAEVIVNMSHTEEDNSL